ncbi:ABC-2 type transport system permease protein [Amycolatopsis marina]|uniref:Transport permease protein n=1 Tax=Amycolatopsis marina TaxID=490629 RepID=A0A1I1CJG7_9PSEU|nr:ABC transporter permease [Amycolatopsis marina]SFB62146.1 ABC-2 type transport system permease protein [Amycolatopsis marina]
MTTLRPAPTVSAPGTVRIGLARGGVELRQFFRQKEHVVFTFSLPAILMVLLGSIFDETYAGTGVGASQVLAAGMIGAGIVSTSFVSMGVGVAMDREDGTLKRLRGTPMPAAAYFVGKVVLVAVSSLAQMILMVTVAMLLFDLSLPTALNDWLTLAWVFALGCISCALLGTAASAMARSVNGASAGMNIVQVTLQFISGVFVTPITSLPIVMVTVSSFFPVKWICQGFRSVFLPDSMTAYEMAGEWELGMVALVLGVWCVLGLLLCQATFRWTNRAE